MKLLFLIPPSEGKNTGGMKQEESVSYKFDKPYDIAINVSQKDLKCKGDRYEQGLVLNKGLFSQDLFETLPVIKRYSGVMYNAIGYEKMPMKAQGYFEDKFMVLSGMYGLLKAQDTIGNYKLPIESKGLYKYWGESITQKINDIDPDYVVNLLPGSYQKVIDKKNLNAKIINVNFLTHKEEKIVKISHGVKKIKGEWIKKICEQQILDYKEFGGDIIEHEKDIDINLIY